MCLAKYTLPAYCVPVKKDGNVTNGGGTPISANFD